MNNRQLAHARHNFNSKQSELKKLQSFLAQNSHLCPPPVLDAISIKQDVLMHDLNALRNRIMLAEGELQ